MRGNEFLDKMELADPAYVAEADRQPPRKRMVWLKWGGLAACLCVVAAAVFALTTAGRVEPPPSPDPTLPSGGPAIDIGTPEAPTSAAYSTLAELLDHLRLHDGHTGTESDGKGGGFSAARAAMEGSDTVSWKNTVYQLNHDTAKWVGIYQNGLLIGTLDAPADYLFVSDGRLIAVGAEYYSGTELDPVYCVRVNIFDPSDPAHPEKLDAFTQLGDLTACWMKSGTLYLMTDDGMCACGYSRLDGPDGYRPQLFHGEEPVPWPDEYIRILGEPSRVSYVAATRIDVASCEVTAQRAFYGDIGDVFFGRDWFALVTSATSESSYTLQDVYTFDGALAFTGKCDMAEVFGLEKTTAWSEEVPPPRSAQRPSVKAVSKAGGVWRMVGEYHHTAGPTWHRELFAVTFDPATGQTAKQTLPLSVEQFDIDDVLWEDRRAIISAGFLKPTDDEGGDCLLAFAEFDGMEITLLSGGLRCDRARGVAGIYWHADPLGDIKPFISLGNGLYLRYNGTPDGFDLFDLSDSANPKRLSRGELELPPGCLLDFNNRVLDENTVAVQLITPGQDSGYRDAAVTWAVFTIDPGSDTPIALQERQYPLTGIDPAAILQPRPD